MKTILVTGANGYIGRHVVSELCRANVEVVTLDTSEQVIDERVRHVSASVLSPGFRLSDQFPTCAFILPGETDSNITIRRISATCRGIMAFLRA